ncbi:MAG: alanine--tRNA ligase [Pseudomonadota bacterium]
MTSVNDLRDAFLSYFEAEEHTRLASAPLVPKSDPTLLFVNAGMVPFKNVFTGKERPESPRATTAQKCVRAGGKHNDLDNVGYTARHHTFFEMMGNFSFGDYFKEDAIALAWRFVTETIGLDADRLLVTVYAHDDDARTFWKKIAGLEDDRIISIDGADNFWSMGDTGPCGPCSEIFFDHGPDIPGGPPGSADEDGDRFIEIWNLVFMQFDQASDGTRAPLPKPSIDTGMGLERMAAVLQGVHNNYEIDLFQALISAAADIYGRKAEGDALSSYRVIADHLRASAFLIADGVSPSNEGRGYVLRRIMRRAMRHGHLLGSQSPDFHKLVPALAGEMGAAYPELVRASDAIQAELEQEETRFQATLGRGLSLLNEAAAPLSKGDTLPGEVAFKLYDTYGFPTDLTADILRGRGITLDTAGFDAAMDRQKEGSRKGWTGSGDATEDELWFTMLDRIGPGAFVGYEDLACDAKLTAIVKDGQTVSSASPGDVSLVFDQTPFYAESGGQSGDKGRVRFSNGAEVVVRDTQKQAGALHVHVGELLFGKIKTGAMAHLDVDAERRGRLTANHSATHLLHAALRSVLGRHVTQKGSLVEEDRLRFDFSHGEPVTDVQMEAIEAMVNAVIRQNTPVTVKVMAPEAAIEAGALALFGEKYGDEVRVLSMGADLAEPHKVYSMELCGGTHVVRTGDIGVFSVLSETGVAAGVRRIEAVSGAEAFEYLKGRVRMLDALAGQLKAPVKDLPVRIASLVDERKSLERALADAKKALAMGGGGAASTGPEDIAGIKLIARVAEGVAAKDLRALVDEAKAQVGTGVVALVGVNEGKAAVSVGVTDDLTGQISAVDLVRLASVAVGGKGGGGRPDMAQAGGPDGAQAEAALDAIRAALTARPKV